MKRSICSGILWMAFATAMTSLVPLCAAQQAAATPPAPVPSQITSAKKVFISNAQGEELDPRVFFLPTISPTQPYDKFYATIKGGGRFDPVLAPADADLILEIRFSFELIPGPNLGGDSSGPHLRLVILDPKTNVLLWALSRPVVASGGPHGKEKRETNFDQAMIALIGDLNLLAAQPAAANGGNVK